MMRRARGEATRIAAELLARQPWRTAREVAEALGYGPVQANKLLERMMLRGVVRRRLSDRPPNLPYEYALIGEPRRAA